MPSRECFCGSREFAGNLQGILLMSMIGDGKRDRWTGSQSARWVLRATLGKSSDRGEPECFRAAWTLREAPGAEDSYCGNPMLLSCSAHEYGSALARPVTVRSAGAVPAPHEAPSPFAGSSG